MFWWHSARDSRRIPVPPGAPLHLDPTGPALPKAQAANGSASKKSG